LVGMTAPGDSYCFSSFSTISVNKIALCVLENCSLS
jgi:hypothetical protein